MGQLKIQLNLYISFALDRSKNTNIHGTQEFAFLRFHYLNSSVVSDIK